jgi:hypothetical protein
MASGKGLSDMTLGFGGPAGFWLGVRGVVIIAAESI